MVQKNLSAKAQSPQNPQGVSRTRLRSSVAWNNGTGVGQMPIQGRGDKINAREESAPTLFIRTVRR